MNVTKELIQIIRQQANFRKIIFNDQNLVDLGLCEKDRPGIQHIITIFMLNLTNFLFIKLTIN